MAIDVTIIIITPISENSSAIPRPCPVPNNCPRLAVVLAKHKMKSIELARLVGITEQNLSILKSENYQNCSYKI